MVRSSVGRREHRLTTLDIGTFRRRTLSNYLTQTLGSCEAGASYKNWLNMTPLPVWSATRSSENPSRSSAAMFEHERMSTRVTVISVRNLPNVVTICRTTRIQREIFELPCRKRIRRAGRKDENIRNASPKVSMIPRMITQDLITGDKYPKEYSVPLCHCWV